MGQATNKLIPIDAVVKDVPPLDTKGHNVVEDTLCIECGWLGMREMKLSL
jgi:hypothetical protein